MTVLVVDDSKVTRKIITRALEELGIQKIDEAEDGTVAWRMFRRGNYDFVITDWNMPNMCGLDLVESIRMIDEEVPVLMITTEAEKQRVVTALQAGVTDYLLKPFEDSHLQEKIFKHLGTEPTDASIPETEAPETETSETQEVG